MTMMTKSNFKFQLLTVLALVALLFTACEKADPLDSGGHSPEQVQNFVGAFTSTGQKNNVDSTDLDVLCFQFQYPITVSFPESDNASFDNEDALWTAIDDWYANNPTSENDPTIVFPITVTLEDGTSKTINDDEALCDLYFDCYDEWVVEEEWEDELEEEWEEECPDYYETCFDLVFPVSIKVGEETYSVDSFEEADSLIYGIIDSTEFDPELDIELLFPVNVILENGTTASINSYEELDELEESCHGVLDICFSVTYPVTLLLPDGTKVVVNNDAEVDSAIDDWEQANPNDDTVIYPEFPITVTTIDSTTQIINTESEFDSLLETCD